MKTSKNKRIWALICILLVIAAWLSGHLRSETSLVPSVHKTVPAADHFVKAENGLYEIWADGAEKDLLGYAAYGRANGYGGPLTMAVAVNPSGKIIHAVISDHKETPAWMSRVLKRRLPDTLDGKMYTDPFETGNDVDAVTGATITSKAIALAVMKGSQAAAFKLGLPLPERITPGLVFGIPEAVLFALFVVGYLNHRKKLKFRKQTRWASMLVGMIVLGFIYDRPFTLVHVSKLTMGYLPQWQNNLYWYFLTFGILIIFIIENRNSYCEWFCPFGAAQECMGLIGGAKLHKLTGHDALRIIQRTIALAAVLLGLYYRNPGITNYELYGSLFSLIGTSIQFAALGLILVAAMFIRRPWCNYLCPIKPLLEIIHVIRQWVKEIWGAGNPNIKM